jgi:hypothetical protein
MSITLFTQANILAWPHVEYVTAFGANDESGGLYRDLEQNLEASLHEDVFWWLQGEDSSAITYTNGGERLSHRKLLHSQ